MQVNYICGRSLRLCFGNVILCDTYFEKSLIYLKNPQCELLEFVICGRLINTINKNLFLLLQQIVNFRLKTTNNYKTAGMSNLITIWRYYKIKYNLSTLTKFCRY